MANFWTLWKTLSLKKLLFGRNKIHRRYDNITEIEN